jgi:anti-sigma factor RsiW
MNRPCPDRQDRIADYVLGALNAGDAEALERHVADCERCGGYLHELRSHDEALAALGAELEQAMPGRRANVIQALRDVTPTETRATRVLPFVGGFVRAAVAAVLLLGAGIAIGRLTAPEPVDVQQLRRDLEQSVAASLRPAVRESVLTEVDQRLQSALTEEYASLSTVLAEQVRRELRILGTQLMSGTEAMMDRRLDDFVQLIEAARLKDRQRVARALEQIEYSRLRDVRQIGLGLQTLAAQTDDEPTVLQN